MNQTHIQNIPQSSTPTFQDPTLNQETSEVQSTKNVTDLAQVLMTIIESIQQPQQQQLFSNLFNGYQRTYDNADSVIHQIISKPHLLWKKWFLLKIYNLPQDQKIVTKNWLLNMNQCQKDFIEEMERVNNALKEQVLLHKKNGTLQIDEILKNADFLENRNYFKKKRQIIDKSKSQEENQNKHSSEHFFDKISSSCLKEEESILDKRVRTHYSPMDLKKPQRNREIFTNERYVAVRKRNYIR